MIRGQFPLVTFASSAAVCMAVLLGSTLTSVPRTSGWCGCRATATVAGGSVEEAALQAIAVDPRRPMPIEFGLLSVRGCAFSAGVCSSA